MTTDTNDTTDDSTDDRADETTTGRDGTETTTDQGAEESPSAHSIEPSAPEEFGLVQVWWGDGKGKTTAAMGMGFRAAGHGYRVHMVQFMKGGAGSVEDVRGEYNAIENAPGFSYENTGHYGWHGFRDGSDDDDHTAQAKGGLSRAREIIEAAESESAESESAESESAESADLSEPRSFDSSPEEGVHMLILDEILYAANRGLIDPEEVVDLVESKPDDLELVLTGGHDRPDYACEVADLVTHVEKEKHPIEAGQSARKGTEF